MQQEAEVKNNRNPQDIHLKLSYRKSSVKSTPSASPKSSTSRSSTTIPCTKPRVTGLPRSLELHTRPTLHSVHPPSKFRLGPKRSSVEPPHQLFLQVFSMPYSLFLCPAACSAEVSLNTVVLRISKLSFLNTHVLVSSPMLIQSMYAWQGSCQQHQRARRHKERWHLWCTSQSASPCGSGCSGPLRRWSRTLHPLPATRMLSPSQRLPLNPPAFI